MYAVNNIKKSYNNIEWVSYHIPKTAGTSFRRSLCDAFGKKSVYGVYARTNAIEFNKGEMAWIPRGTKLLHGHFYPHRNHENLFKNAKKIIWLRDPVKRAWSLLNHTLDIKNNKIVLDYINKKFLNPNALSREEMFLSILADEKSKLFFTKYHASLSNFSKSYFDFIGNTEEYERDLNRLSGLMNKELKNFQVNLSSNHAPPPAIPTKLLSYFDQEYRVFNALTSG